MQEAMNAHPQAREAWQQRQRSAAAAGVDLGITAESTSAESTPFDALAADDAGQGGPDSLVSLDEDGLPEDEQRLFGEQAAAIPFDQSEDHAEPVPDQRQPWQPREVPQAHYMVAERAERPEAEPIQTQQPEPTSEVKLKQPAAAPAAPDEQSVDAEQHSIDLDAVLKRRRA